MIKASDLWVPMRKSLGDKRREISEEHLEQIMQMFHDFKEGENTKIFKTTDFGYRKITVDRPLKLNFEVSSERLEKYFSTWNMHISDRFSGNMLPPLGLHHAQVEKSRENAKCHRKKSTGIFGTQKKMGVKKKKNLSCGITLLWKYLFHTRTRI